MTRREKLQEQYEDASFALLMDDLAVEEGKKAYEENERLKADSSFEVPSESRKRCVETIARCCRKKQFQGISNRCYHAFSKVAVIAMLTIMLATAAFAASPTLRASAMNLLVETFEDHTGFRLVYFAIEHQIAYLTRFAEKHHYTVIDIYSDIGLPGHDLTRPELNRMKQAAEKGMFDAIFVVNRDRLFRGRWTEAPMFPVPIIVADEVRMKRKEEHLH